MKKLFIYAIILTMFMISVTSTPPSPSTNLEFYIEGEPKLNNPVKIILTLELAHQVDRGPPTNMNIELPDEFVVISGIKNKTYDSIVYGKKYSVEVVAKPTELGEYKLIGNTSSIGRHWATLIVNVNEDSATVKTPGEIRREKYDESRKQKLIRGLRSSIPYFIFAFLLIAVLIYSTKRKKYKSVKKK